MDSFGSRVREWLQRVLGTVTRRRTDRDLEQELRSHLELAEAEARHADGESKDGRRTARLEAGGVAQAMDALRDQRGLPALEDLVRDARYAMRTLRRSPVFAAVAIVTLTLGIGANAAIFQLLDVIRLRPPAGAKP